jgi:hypothetical protein
MTPEHIMQTRSTQSILKRVTIEQITDVMNHNNRRCLKNRHLR